MLTGGTYYVVSANNIVAFDNLESSVNEDAVGKYKFVNDDNLELIVFGLSDTTQIELKKIKR